MSSKVLVLYDGDALCIDRDVFYRNLTDLPLVYLRPHLGEFTVCEVYRYERLMMMLDVILNADLKDDLKLELELELETSSVYEVYERLRPGTPNRTGMQD